MLDERILETLKIINYKPQTMVVFIGFSDQFINKLDNKYFKGIYEKDLISFINTIHSDYYFLINDISLDSLKLLLNHPLSKGGIHFSNRKHTENFKEYKYLFKKDDFRLFFSKEIKYSKVSKLYSAGTLLGKLRKIYILFIGFLFKWNNLPSFFVYGKVNALFFNSVVFNGTKGVTRKLTILKNIEDKDYFIKHSLNDKSSDLINNEYNILKYLHSQKLDEFHLPKIEPIYYINNLCLFHQNSILDKSRKDNGNFSKLHLKFIVRFFNLNNKCEKFENHKTFKYLISHPKISDKDCNMLHQLKNKNLHSNVSHGDFTSWNLYINKDKLAIFDWEYGNVNSIAFYDFFHYIIQTQILLKHNDSKSIHKLILNKSDNLLKETGVSFNDFVIYYYIYLLKIFFEYTDQLDDYNPGFPQVEWQQKTRKELLIIVRNILCDYL